MEMLTLPFYLERYYVLVATYTFVVHLKVPDSETTVVSDSVYEGSGMRVSSGQIVREISASVIQ